ncbi:MAG: hypothetical protein LBR16_01430 [Treponema sp.]|jgi:hypothetical protein|nr:hypothetical protein [Treponema sp.]
MYHFSNIEEEIDAIRDRIYEEIKDMSAAEQTNYFNSRAEKVCAQFGLKVFDNVPQAQSAMAAV